MNRFVKGHLMALFVSIIWGTTFIATKLLLVQFHPVEIILIRFTAAWAILFLISPKPLWPKGFKSELPFVAAGLTGLALYFLLESTALTYTLASNCGIIISVSPMFTASFLWLSRRAPRPRPVFFLGFALAITGISLISLRGSQLQLNPLGDFLVLCAAMCWGCYGVCLEIASSRGLTTLQTTRKVFFWGLLFTGVYALLNADHLQLTNFARFGDPVMVFNLLYLSVGASALCFILWNRAIHLIGSVSTNLYIYLSPVISLTASALILGEPITPMAIGAAGLIVLGLWLSQRRPKTVIGTPEANMPQA